MVDMKEFLEIKNELRYCPICSWWLVDDLSNAATRSCVTHGRIFSIYQTVNGYYVEVLLAQEQRTDSNPPTGNELPDVREGPDISGEPTGPGMS